MKFKIQKFFFFPILIIFLSVIKITAQEKISSIEKFHQLISENIHKVDFEHKKAYGEGIDWLVKEGSKAQYFLIGERHGLAEIPQISSSIFMGLRTVGYDYAALEFGPFAAIQVEKYLQKGKYPALKKYLESPIGFNSVAFLDWVEEAEMAAEMFEASKSKDGFFWGLDQEHFYGFPSHLEFLESHSKSDEQKEAVLKMKQSLEQNERLLATITPDELKLFTNNFRDSNSEEVKDLLSELEITNYIYGAWAKPKRIANSESNIVREDYMKKNFLKYIEKAKLKDGKDPKVFFKFGGMHSAPHIDTRSGKITLGTLIESYAFIHGNTAFNLFVECYSGSRKSSGQDAGGQENVSYDCGTYFGNIDATVELNKEVHPFSSILDGFEGVFLIDLRPIRLRMDEFKFLSDDTRTLISSFDAYMTIPNTLEATSFERSK